MNIFEKNASEKKIYKNLMIIWPKQQGWQTKNKISFRRLSKTKKTKIGDDKYREK